ncbi:MAG: hypothetical protein ACI9C9_002792 [Marivirga sp.]|jgi:hypothetical protein
MKNRIINYRHSFLLVLVCLLSGILVYSLLQKKELLNKFEKQIQAYELDITSMEGYIRNQLRLQDKKLDGNLSIRTMNNQEVTLRNIIEERKDSVVIVAFKWDACRDCLKQEIAFINLNKEIFEHVVFLTSFKNHQAFTAYARRLQIDWPIYNYRWSEDLILQDDNNHGVFAFVTDQSLSIMWPHLASSAYSNLSDQYYKTISGKISETSYE